MTRKEKMKKYVLPLVQTNAFEWNGFVKDGFGSQMSLQMKLIKHTRTGNREKVIKYLAFCAQTWPIVKDCPIDMDIIGEAIDIL